MYPGRSQNIYPPMVVNTTDGDNTRIRQVKQERYLFTVQHAMDLKSQMFQDVPEKGHFSIVLDTIDGYTNIFAQFNRTNIYVQSLNFLYLRNVFL